MFEKEHSPKAVKARRQIASRAALGLIGALVCATCASVRAATLTEIHGFSSGESPYAGVIQGQNGNLYGTTPTGGANKKGTVFQVTTSGQLVYSIDFNGNNNGASPYAPLVQGADGTLYGTTSAGGSQGKGTVFKISPDGTLSVLFAFAKTNGSTPYGGLILVSNSVLYGTTSEGGTNGDGTVFQIGTNGSNFQMLMSFSGTNGANPYAGVVLGKDGNLYGTTKYGGASGQGTAFSITPAGKFTSLLSFNGDNGAYPNGLMLASDGSFYGTTTWGGPNGLGLVFKLKSSGSISTVAAFAGYNGAAPNGGLLQAANGNFYGTTQLGGNGYGSVFKLNSSALTSLINFDGNSGSSPECTLIQASNSDIYGTTQSGGSGGDGNVFQLSGFSPVITGKPSNQTVVVGSNAVFTVTVMGAEPITYQWQKNGTNLVDGGKISGATTSQLTLTNVTTADAGTYGVTIKNSDGSDSASAKLTLSGAPVVSITSPAINARSNAFVFSGSVTSTLQVVSVNYWVTNFNNGVSTITGPSQATLAGTNLSRLTWTAAPQMSPGTNVIAVQALDVQSNQSAIVTRSVFVIQTAALTLETIGTGTGTISVPSGTLYNIGQAYTIQAKVGKNSLFAGWTGSLGAQPGAKLSFIMEPKLTLKAVFETNRFPTASGVYNGLFSNTNNPQPESSGTLTALKIDSMGSFSGKLALGGKTVNISGRFDPYGVAVQTVVTNPLPVTLSLNYDWATGRILGTLSQTNGWTASLTAERAGNNTLPASARYDFLMPSANGTNPPVGYGYGQLVNRSGAVTLSGALADGTALSQTISVSVNSRIPVYANLYTNSGAVLGWLDLSSGSPSGQLLWIKNVATNGFTNETAISGWRWTPPASKTYALSQTNFALTIWGADLATPIRCQMQATPAYKLVKVASANPQLASPNAVLGQIDSKTGLIKLTFAPDNTGKSVTAFGVIDPTTGAGEFTKNGLSGAFKLEPLTGSVQ